MATEIIIDFSIFWFGKRYKDLTTEEMKCYKRNMMRKQMYGFITTPTESTKSLTRNSDYNHDVKYVGPVRLRRQRYDGYKQTWGNITCCCGCSIKTMYSGEHIITHMKTKKHTKLMEKTKNKERSVFSLIDSQWKFSDEELLRDVVVSGAV